MGSIAIGSQKTVIKPFLYNPNIIHFSDDFEGSDIDTSKWTQAETGGTYSVSNDTITLVTENTGDHVTFYSAQDIVEDYVALYFRAKVSGSSGSATFGLCDIIPSDNSFYILVRYTSEAGKYEILLKKGPDTVLTALQTIYVDPDTWFEGLIVYVGGSFTAFIKREGIDSDWQPVIDYHDDALEQYMKKIWFGAHDGTTAVIDKIILYESAGTGIKDLRPIMDWSNGYDPSKILTDTSGYYLFWGTEGYYTPSGLSWGMHDRIILLKTNDFVNWEIVEHITICVGIAGQGILFKWTDGKIHGYIMNWSSESAPYQNGLHRILYVEMDENFNNITINENVTLVNAPCDSNQYDIWLVKIQDQWYAVTSSLTSGTHVWELDSPTSLTFTFYKTIFSEYRENVMIVPATDEQETVLLMSLFDKSTSPTKAVIYKLDTDFNVLGEITSQDLSATNGGVMFLLNSYNIFIVHDNEESPYNLLTHDGGFVAHVYDITTDYTYTTIEEQSHFTTTPEKVSISVEAGKSFSINVTVTNDGSAQGTAEVRLKDHNNNIVSTEEVTLSAGASKTVTLTATAPSTEGTYQWIIETYNMDTQSVDDTDTITLNVTTPTPTKKEETPLWILLLLLIFFLVLLSRRRY